MDPEILGHAAWARYFGCDSETRSALIRSLARLPEDVREFAVDQCVFISVGRSAHGICRSADMAHSAKWIILVNERLAPRNIESAIAHEVAHAWHGHRVEDTSTTHEEIEREARLTARSWGFRGLGAEPQRNPT